MKKLVVLTALLVILSSCTVANIANSTEVSSEELPPIYNELVFDNQTPLDEMKICNITELQYRICFPRNKGGSLSHFLTYDEFKDDFEHLYIRRNGKDVYAAARIKYEGEIYYFFITLEIENHVNGVVLEGRDGALIYKKLLDISDFSDIKPDESIRKEVKQIDKAAFIYDSNISDHRLRDERMLHVIYKEWRDDIPGSKNGIVERIVVVEDRYHFLDKLLPMDRDVIT
jgi:hypothetical protein